LLSPRPLLSREIWNKARKAIYKDASELSSFCEDHSTKPDVNDLLLWSHWITPLGQKSRFETQFFLKLLPKDTEADILAYESAGIILKLISKMAQKL
jgi:hypothetical protein